MLNSFVFCGLVEDRPKSKGGRDSGPLEMRVRVKRRSWDREARKEVTAEDVVPITCWPKRADVSQLEHGDLVSVQGHAEMRSWEKDGTTRTFLELVADEVHSEFLNQPPPSKRTDTPF